MFEPLGYELVSEPIALDDKLSYLGERWDQSPYVALSLSGTVRLRDLLSHIYVLIPVLDKRKHYYVDRHELEKLIEKGESWLGGHPGRELIANRYLRFKRSWAREVLMRLAIEAIFEEEAAESEATQAETPDPVEPQKDAAEAELERPIQLHELRLDTVARKLQELGARRVVDLGCGSGKLLKRLVTERMFKEVVGIDVSTASLENAARRLRLENLSEQQKGRIKLLQGALTYRDRRIEGFDAAALVEVIEHLDADRLAALERAVFEFAQPEHVIITTPKLRRRTANTMPSLKGWNQASYGMPITASSGHVRSSHAGLSRWRSALAMALRLTGIGEEDPACGAPSQMAVFSRV